MESRKKSERLNIVITEGDKARLLELVKVMDVSEGHIVRQALRMYYNAMINKAPEEPKE
jgi:hypothetical protein